VGVPQQVVDQGGVLADGFGAVAVADARGLHDAGVPAEVVHEAHEAVVEDVESFAQEGVGGGDGRAFHACGA